MSIKLESAILATDKNALTRYMPSSPIIAGITPNVNGLISVGTQRSEKTILDGVRSRFKKSMLKKPFDLEDDTWTYLSMASQFCRKKLGSDSTSKSSTSLQKWHAATLAKLSLVY